ncbi:Methionine-binding lipoprotein MetQ [termite gut metagenome]|uniref:Methionine-binding lipoprotein MetQ n=1 Tax=termite gut metagenome TaxID=433724 RepID=A0A5J4S4D3_9ZZZZ
MNRNIPLLCIVVAVLSACTSKKQQNVENSDGEKKTITISTSQKPTYADMITYAIQPILEKKGYTVKIVQMSESQLIYKVLGEGGTDAHVGGHKAAFNYLKKYGDMEVHTLITVPSAHLGLFSDKLFGTMEDIKRQLKKGDTVILPEDPTNLPRSLVFLENLGLLTLKEDINKFESTEKDVAENPYGLEIKVLNAAQIPRSLGSVTLAVIFGDDADLLGILDSAIIREINPDEQFMNMFVTKPGNENKPWIKDLVEAIKSEAFKNVIEDPQYRFFKYWRPLWYVEKWGITNRTGNN